MRRLAVIAVVCLLAGCARSVYYPVTVASNDSLTHSRVSDSDTERVRETIVRDSVIEIHTDSVVRIREVHYERDYSYERLLQGVIDSLMSVSRDSVPYPVRVTEFVEKPLREWQRVLMVTGALALAGLALFIVIRFIR